MSWQWKLIIGGIILSIIFPPLFLGLIIAIAVVTLSGAKRVKPVKTLYRGRRYFIIINENNESYLCLEYYTSIGNALLKGQLHGKKLNMWHTKLFDTKLITIPKDNKNNIQTSMFKYGRELNNYIKMLLEKEN